MRLLTNRGAAGVAAIAMWAGACASARADLTWNPPLTLNSPNLVGAVSILQHDQASGTPTTELSFAQALLNLGANQSFTDVNGRWWGTAPTDYNGTIITTSYATGTQNVAAGWDYAIAKYDGQNAGYILFYLGGQAADLPLDSYSFWTTNPQKYQISGFTAFDVQPSGGGGSPPPVPEARTLMAGALLLLPFGASTLRIVWKRRVARSLAETNMSQT